MLQIFQDSFREDNIGEECIFQAFIDPRIQNFSSYGATSGIYWIHYKPPVLSYLEVVTHSFSYVSLLRKLDFPLSCFLVNVFFLWICSHLLKKSSTESFNFCADFYLFWHCKKWKVIWISFDQYILLHPWNTWIYGVNSSIFVKHSILDAWQSSKEVSTSCCPDQVKENTDHIKSSIFVYFTPRNTKPL